MDKIEMKKDLEDIKKITSVTVKQVCKELRVNEKNMYNLRTTKENVKKVKFQLIKELKEIIQKIEG